MRARRRRSSAITLLELIVSVAILAILSLAISGAFRAGIDFDRHQAQNQGSLTTTESVQGRLRQLIEGAKVSSDTTDTATYFVATSETDGELGADRLTFTTTAPDLSLAIQANTDDFQTSHETNGPVGGLAEVSLGTTAVGDAGTNSGLFQRIQRPADGDDTQGGEESVLSDQIEKIGFEFYNGAEWVTTWDSVNTTPGRIPAAVRVSYTVVGDNSGAVRKFVVPVPASDATADNPAEEATQ